jgi:hypothetical protein
VIRFESWTDFDYPIYEVCLEDAAYFAEGDADVARPILSGRIALHEMPKELRDDSLKIKERTEWLRAKAEEFHEQRLALLKRRGISK